MATELRVRSKIHPDTLEAMKGKVMDDRAYDVLLTGPTNMYGSDGQLLAKYLPGALDEQLLSDTYGVLHGLKVHETYNRQLASGTQAVEHLGRNYTEKLPSAIIGSFDAKPPYNYCRLTAWSGKEVEQFASLFPLFRSIGGYFKEQVPARYGVQMMAINRTHPDWVIPSTPFTTITVNNSYPTGVHTDKGDLDEGFSNLAVLRRGNYRGGIFVFTEYRVGVDMQHGDLLLMDAHQWHGNTAMFCNVCGERMGPGGTTGHDERCSTERISIVCYYRTKMEACGSMEDEAVRAKDWAERRASISAQTVDEMAQEAG